LLARSDLIYNEDYKLALALNAADKCAQYLQTESAAVYLVNPPSKEPVVCHRLTKLLNVSSRRPSATNAGKWATLLWCAIPRPGLES